MTFFQEAPGIFAFPEDNDCNVIDENLTFIQLIIKKRELYL